MSGALAENSLSPICHFFQAHSLEETSSVRVEVVDHTMAPENDPVSNRFFDDLLGRPKLLSLIQSFAHRPQAWIHQSHFTQGAFPLHASESSDRLEIKMASGICRTFNLPDLDYGLFQNLPWRLALLNFETLDKLSENIGLINLLHGFDPTNLVHRTTIIKQLGELNFGELAKLAAEDSFTATARMPKDWTDDVDQAARLIGWNSLGSVFANAPKSILKRIHMKLPREAAKKFRSGCKKSTFETEQVGSIAIHIFQQTEANTEFTCIF